MIQGEMENRSVGETTFLVSSENELTSTKRIQRKGQKDWLQEISPLCYALIAFFASPSQLATYGVAVEIPLLLNWLPEGLALPSYFALVIQAGNIGPVVFVFLNWLFPKKIKDWAVICFVLATGSTCTLLMASHWQETSYAVNGEHSTAFFALLACMSFTDGTASVVFWAYMVNFKSQYLSALFLGQTLGGVLPAVVGLVQGTVQPICVETNSTVFDSVTNKTYVVGVVTKKHQEPRFSAKVFFVSLFVIYVISFVAFALLEFSSLCADEKLSFPCTAITDVKPHPKEIEKKRKRRRQIRDDDLPLHLVKMTPSGFSTECYAELTESLRTVSASTEFEREHLANEVTEAQQMPDGESSDPGPTENSFPTCSVVILLILCALMDALRACVIPSLASYGCTPYGHGVYGLTVKLMTISGPIGCVASLFIRHVSVRTTCALATVAAGLTCYLVLLAVMNPDPPLYYDTMGAVLVVSRFYNAIGSNVNHMITYCTYIYSWESSV